MREQILKMPKIELHLHLDGAIRAETLLELAEQDGVELPTKDLAELHKYLQVATDCPSLGEYLSKFELPLAVMQTKNSLERVAYELCEILARENVRYFEVRFAPQLHTRKGLRLDEVVAAVLDGLNEGQIEFNLKVGLILCALRHHPVELNVEIANLAGRFRDKGVVAVDLAGDEASYPVEDHQLFFERAQELGLHITIHAGEASGAESIKKAITLGAERIGHGVSLFEDADLLEEVKAAQILLEICPKSNYHTKAVASISDHPAKKYFDQGLRINLNTDNPTVSETTLSAEYLSMIEELGFTFEDLRQMTVYAAEAAFLPESEKLELIKIFKA